MLLRPDLEVITSLIPPSARVVDIGCGEGELLEHLKSSRQIDARGIELSQKNVSACVARGLSVVQGDADTDLSFYPDKSFDYAVMAQALQATDNPRKVLEEMLRIATHAIVSIPNFGHWKNRLYLLLNGRMPVTEQLSFEWYETPNIHFCTLSDFNALCTEIGCRTERKMALDGEGKPLALGAFSGLENLLAAQGLYVLGSKF